MAPHLILFVAGLTSAWAMLSVIGGERQRILQNAELLRRAEAEAAAAARADEQSPAKRLASNGPSVKKPVR